MREAARNEGGTAGAGMGMGMGFAMANQMGQALSQGGASQQGTPPPIPQQVKRYYAAIDNQQAGPFDAPTLQQKIRDGQITRQTLVWCDGMTDWTAAGDVPDLQSYWPAGPPPLPPQS
jgi:hypothetical protein